MATMFIKTFWTPVIGEVLTCIIEKMRNVCCTTTQQKWALTAHPIKLFSFHGDTKISANLITVVSHCLQK